MLDINVKLALDKAFPQDSSLVKKLEETFRREKLYTLEAILEEDKKDPNFFKDDCQLARGDVHKLRNALLEQGKRGGLQSAMPDIASMTLQQLLQEFVEGSTRAEKIYEALQPKVSVVLLEGQGIHIRETVALYEEKRALPQVGELYGRYKYKVATLASCYGKRIAMPPYCGDKPRTALVNGFDNETKADWLHVFQDVQYFVAWMALNQTEELFDLSPRRAAKDFSKLTMEQVQTVDTWEYPLAAYREALEKDKNLSDMLKNYLYPPETERMEAPTSPRPSICSPVGGKDLCNREAFIELRTILCRLVSRPNQIRMIVSDAGLSEGQIDFQGSTTAIWENALSEAERTSAIFQIARHVKNEVYPKNPELLNWLQKYDR